MTFERWLAAAIVLPAVACGFLGKETRSLVQGSYEVRGDCPGALREGTLTVDNNLEIYTFDDAKAFGFPDNTVTGKSKLTSENGERVCHAALVGNKPKTVTFACEEPKGHVVCTVVLRR